MAEPASPKAGAGKEAATKARAGFREGFRQKLIGSISSKKGAVQEAVSDALSPKSRTVQIGELRAGDHVYCWRVGGIYAHHGVVIAGAPEGVTDAAEITEAIKVVEFAPPHLGGQDLALTEESPTLDSLVESASMACEEEEEEETKDQGAGSGTKSTITDSSILNSGLQALSKLPNLGELDPSKAVIQEVTLGEFSGGAVVRRVNYDADKHSWRGTAAKRQSFPAEEVVERALSVLSGKEEWGQYNLLSNNCEHFSTWCKSGEKRSGQISDNIVSRGARNLGAISPKSLPRFGFGTASASSKEGGEGGEAAPGDATPDGDGAADAKEGDSNPSG